jgi:hypothetical protein
VIQICYPNGKEDGGLNEIDTVLVVLELFIIPALLESLTEFMYILNLFHRPSKCITRNMNTLRPETINVKCLFIGMMYN